MEDIAAHIMSLDEFKRACKDGSFIDYDGHGELVRLTLFPLTFTQLNVRINPSEMAYMTHHSNATHVVWYNK